jgi:hypothetical protein
VIAARIFTRVLIKMCKEATDRAAAATMPVPKVGVKLAKVGREHSDGVERSAAAPGGRVGGAGGSSGTL